MSTPETQLLFDPFPKQLEFLEKALDKVAELVIYGGAIRGGKTFVSLGALVVLCKMYPNSRWAIVRKDLPTLKGTYYHHLERLRQIVFKGWFV